MFLASHCQFTFGYVWWPKFIDPEKNQAFDCVAETMNEKVTFIFRKSDLIEWMRLLTVGMGRETGGGNHTTRRLWFLFAVNPYRAESAGKALSRACVSASIKLSSFALVLKNSTVLMISLTKTALGSVNTVR